MKAYYLRHKHTKQVVTATFDYSDEGSWTDLEFDGHQPYFNSVEFLQKIVDGYYTNAWSFDMTKDLKHALNDKQIEIVEIML